MATSTGGWKKKKKMRVCQGLYYECFFSHRCSRKQFFLSCLFICWVSYFGKELFCPSRWDDCAILKVNRWFAYQHCTCWLASLSKRKLCILDEQHRNRNSTKMASRPLKLNDTSPLFMGLLFWSTLFITDWLILHEQLNVPGMKLQTFSPPGDNTVYCIVSYRFISSSVSDYIVMKYFIEWYQPTSCCF